MGDELVVPSVRGTFLALVLIGFFARLSYGMARTPLLSLFARALGGGPAFIGLVVRMSTVTGIFFKAPAGTLSDVYGRRAVMLVSVLIFGLMPFTYLIVDDYRLLTVIRFFHSFATAIYGPVAMAVIMDSAGHRKGSSWAPTPRRRPWADSLQRPSAAASSSSWGAPSPPLVSSAPST